MCNESLVYLNKVYTDIQASSCPLLTGIVATSQNFNQQLTYMEPKDDCCCRCACPQDLEGELTFAVESTEVFVSDFNMANPNCLEMANVTVDGIAVDDLDFFNDRFSASTNALMSQISDCACMERNKSTAGYFLITGISEWRAKLTMVLRGSVFGCGSCKRFKLVMTSKEGIHVPISGNSTFASPKICLPCTTNGIAPIISFSFGATAALLNPAIVSESACGRNCNVTVTGSLITEPTVNVQVTRATLFRTDAETINLPCDDSARCKDAPGICRPGEADDDSHALRIHERCCSSALENSHRDCSCSCSCESSCECGTSCDTPCQTSWEQGHSCRRDNRDICCQFNGCNGCRY